MSPLLLLILAILTPILLLLVLCVPTYAGLYGASYIVYNTGAKVHPLADKYFDVFYIIDVYSKLFSYWRANMSNVSFVHYTLPVVGLPLVMIVLSFWLARRIARKMKDIFHLSAG